MGVRSAATKLHIPPSAARRPTFLPFVAVLLLCSASYLIGVWQHGGFATPSDKPAAVSTSTAVACTNIAATPKRTTRSGASSPSLDFSARHAAAADDASTATAASSAVPRRSSYPACPARYSEYTPCEDVERSLRFPRDRLVYRERHCPASERERLRCLVPAPPGYRTPFPWPASRDVAWFANAPHKELTVEKAVQNWIRVDGDRLRFPGGGTMFPNGADAYIDDIAKLVPLHDGSIRTALDTGCGVSSRRSRSRPPRWLALASTEKISGFGRLTSVDRVRLENLVPIKALFGYSQCTWIGWDWKKIRRSLTCLGFKPIQSRSIHMD
jgi:hypothetical protein